MSQSFGPIRRRLPVRMAAFIRHVQRLCCWRPLTRKYLRMKAPSRAVRGAPQLRHDTSRSAAAGASIRTTRYCAPHCVQWTIGGGGFVMRRNLGLGYPIGRQRRSCHGIGAEAVRPPRSFGAEPIEQHKDTNTSRGEKQPPAGAVDIVKAPCRQ